MHGVIGAGVILSVMGGGVFTNVLAAPNAWPTEVLAPLFVCAGTEWLVPWIGEGSSFVQALPPCVHGFTYSPIPQALGLVLAAPICS